MCCRCRSVIAGCNDGSYGIDPISISERSDSGLQYKAFFEDEKVRNLVCDFISLTLYLSCADDVRRTCGK